MAAQPNIEQLEALIQQQADQIAQLEAEVERLKHLLQAKAAAKAAKPPPFPANDSLNRTPRTRRKKKRKSPGRTPHAAKRELAAHAVGISPRGARPRRVCATGRNLPGGSSTGKRCMSATTVMTSPSRVSSRCRRACGPGGANSGSKSS